MSYPIEKNELLQRVKTAVQDIVPTAKVILYGSRARGTAHIDSDWDFLILLPTPSYRQLETEIKDSLYEVELATDTVLSSVVRTQQDWESPRYAVLPLHQQVEQDGVVL